MNISLFSKITDIKTSNQISFTDFYDNVRAGKWEDIVNKVRIENDKVKRDEIKKTLPYVTISGIFSERKAEGLIKHSGLLCIDFDDIDNIAEVECALQSDPYSLCIMRSASGRGIAAIVKITPSKHEDAFKGLEAYYFQKYKLIADTKCKDIARARFVTYDPHAFINPNSLKFDQYLPKKRPIKKLPKIFYAESDFQILLGKIQENAVDLTGTYHQWLDIGFAIENEFGESGRDYFHIISQNHPDYSPEICNRQYTNCLKARGHGITIATFFYYAKEAGLEIVSRKTKEIVAQAKQAKRNQRSVDNAVYTLENMMDIPPQDSRPLVEQVFSSSIDTRSDSELPLIDQIEIFLRNNFHLRRNLITRFIELDGRQIEAKDFNTIGLKAKKTVNEKVSFDLVERIICSDFTEEYNPFNDFFEKYSYRKPSGLIKKLCETIETDTGFADNEFTPQYKEYFITRWLVGIISAAHGDHSPLLLVLHGGQNTGKSEWFRRLLPSELRYYYAESKLDQGKDDHILMTQKLIIMDDEMGGKSKREAKQLKDLTSKQMFTLREPYGRSNVDLQRIAVLCGTSNDESILNDPTGNRRIIPVNVIAINQQAYNDIDKIDLLMEAYHLWKSDFKWQLSSMDIRLLNDNTTDFESPSTENELVQRYFEIPENEEEAEKMTNSDIKVYIELATRQKLDPMRLGLELKRLGFVRKASARIPVPDKPGSTKPARNVYLVKKISFNTQV